ncbi:DUF6266 family protein [Pedobacter frigoris]|uniref:Uncharacterized protein n=1 Tax=Pedobacter frigoris TaxID=2571272 RepID=A0A4U1CMW5_9SPHI|nr:DUF6266 family protein [Pedobacter frigoris]TKC09241.1 hypothetical protein FA047_03890 [Pedobacter frigoris]
MARSSTGAQGLVTGKIGNTYYYVRYGKQQVRAASHIIKPKSEKQLAQQQRMSVLKPVISYLKLYIRVGFALKGIEKADSASNCFRSYNLKHAIKGQYPNQEIDYPAVRLSEGNLSLPLNAAVQSVADGFKFTWAFDAQDPNGSPYDRTMLLVYFPEVDQPRFFQIISGAERSDCEELLKVPVAMKGRFAETYISFITDDRSSISDSVYTGRVLC